MTPELLNSIKEGEGFRAKVYMDTLGNPTVGYGQLVRDLVVTEQQASEWLADNVKRIERELEKDPRFQAIEEQARKDVLIEMAYNMGITGLMTFSQTWACIVSKNYEKAALNMLSSLWAKQVKLRAIRLATQMRTGSYPPLRVSRLDCL